MRKGGSLGAIGGDGGHNLGSVGHVVGMPSRDAGNNGEDSSERGLHFDLRILGIIIRYSAKSE